MGEEKQYRIGDAADLLEIKTHTLRFWESQFEQVIPVRSAKGQRVYTETHLILLRRIKHLLYDCGMTIEGVRKVLEHDALPEENVVSSENLLQHIEQELIYLKQYLLDKE